MRRRRQRREEEEEEKEDEENAGWNGREGVSLSLSLSRFPRSLLVGPNALVIEAMDAAVAVGAVLGAERPLDLIIEQTQTTTGTGREMRSPTESCKKETRKETKGGARARRRTSGGTTARLDEGKGREEWSHNASAAPLAREGSIGVLNGGDEAVDVADRPGNKSGIAQPQELEEVAGVDCGEEDVEDEPEGAALEVDQM